MGCILSVPNRDFPESPFSDEEDWVSANKYRLTSTTFDSNVSHGEARLIQNQWLKFMKKTDKVEIGMRIMQTVFEKDSDAKVPFGLHNLSSEEILTNKKFRLHCHLFIDHFELIIHDMVFSPTNTASKLVTFGSHHQIYVRRGFKAKFWQIMGQGLLDLGQTIRPIQVSWDYRSFRFHKAWRKMIRFIIFNIQLGYVLENHKGKLSAKETFNSAIITNDLFYLLRHSSINYQSDEETSESDRLRVTDSLLSSRRTSGWSHHMLSSLCRGSMSVHSSICFSPSLNHLTTSPN